MADQPRGAQSQAQEQAVAVICPRPRCGLLMAEDERFAADLGGYNIQRQRFYDVAGHSVYVPPPHAPVVNICASHRQPKPCAACQLAFQRAYYIRKKRHGQRTCKTCQAVYVPTGAKQDYCPGCSKSIKLERRRRAWKERYSPKAAR